MNRIATLATMLFLLIGAFSCSQEQPIAGPGEELSASGAPAGRVLGVCFMGGEPCMGTYEDRGPYAETEEGGEKPSGSKQQGMVPVYVFPSVPDRQGGVPNPFDPSGRYKPYRLQNNVFARPGRAWAVWEVHSADLLLMAEPVPGVQLWGVGTNAERETTGEEEPPERRRRDLFVDPITSEEELLDLARQGDVKLVNTFFSTDCPVTEPLPGDEVVNLNPTFPLCNAGGNAR